MYIYIAVLSTCIHIYIGGVLKFMMWQARAAEAEEENNKKDMPPRSSEQDGHGEHDKYIYKAPGCSLYIYIIRSPP